MSLADVVGSPRSTRFPPPFFKEPIEMATATVQASAEKTAASSKSPISTQHKKEIARMKAEQDANLEERLRLCNPKHAQEAELKKPVYRWKVEFQIHRTQKGNAAYGPIRRQHRRRRWRRFQVSHYYKACRCAGRENCVGKDLRRALRVAQPENCEAEVHAVEAAQKLTLGGCAAASQDFPRPTAAGRF